MTLLPRAASVFEKLPRVFRRHRLMTGWMRATGENPVQLVRIRDRTFGYADLSDGFLRLIVIDGHFEDDFFRLADGFLSDGGVMLDVGANHGLLSFGVASRHAATTAFHLFEPNPALVQSIEATKARYPSMRCTIKQAAVSERTGTVRFVINPSQTGNSHIEAGAGQEVRAIAIDDYLRDEHIEQVAMLKMDVEGYELAALRGAREALAARRIQAIYFEYFEKYLIRVAPPQALIDYLHEMGYLVCFCRHGDLDARGGGSHTICEGLPGHGVPLIPVTGHTLPAMTDLLAVPRENLAVRA